MQIDVLEKGIEKKTSEISNLLQSVGIGTISSATAGVVIPTLGLGIIGIAFFPGVIVFGGTYYLINKIVEWNKKR